ncbi:MAG: FAD-dependent monooxygenase [Pseudomonadota bacterium]
MTDHTQRAPKRAIVIGGSLGGLFAGSLLRSIGWEVDIYERSTGDLDSRGGGIVLQPEVSEVLKRIGAIERMSQAGVHSRHRTVFAPDGTILDKRLAPQIQTSWSLVYNEMHDYFGEAHYHQGKTLARIEQDREAKTATAIFEDGSRATGDLLIGADGNGSTVRQLLWSDSQPTYAGYFAWRGLVDETAMPARARQDLHGDFAFASSEGSHMLGYLVPGDGGDLREGHRLYNFVWYRTASEARLAEIMTDKTGRARGVSLPEGLITDHWRERVYNEARALLPPGFRDLVLATDEPFAQAIRDLKVSHMVDGRVILLGDAAFVPRPHTAASTSKAAANALALADLLEAQRDVDTVLSLWEPDQLRLGNRLYDAGRSIGDRIMFKSRRTA